MATYVDGFVFTVPKKNLAAYQKMAKDARKVWMKHGALDYKECMGEDLTPKSMGGMKPLGFKQLTKAKPSEVVFFSYIVYKSRAQRDAINKKVMADPVLAAYGNMPMPFDMKRLTYGGFTAVVE